MARGLSVRAVSAGTRARVAGTADQPRQFGPSSDFSSP
jgi:hypothetical protein